MRKHTPQSRPLHAKGDDSAAVNVADARVVVYDSVAETTKLWIKGPSSRKAGPLSCSDPLMPGRDFTIANLITDKVAARQWAEGAVASYRLSPQGSYPIAHFRFLLTYRPQTIIATTAPSLAQSVGGKKLTVNTTV